MWGELWLSWCLPGFLASVSQPEVSVWQLSSVDFGWEDGVSM